MKKLLFIILLSACASSSSSHKQQVCKSLLDIGAARGMSCLHCMVRSDKAEASAKSIVDTLYSSCLKKPAISFLTPGGGFGFNPSILNYAITKLTSGGRTPTFEFYLLNGPSQRKYRDTPVDGLGTKTNPHIFRGQIQSNYKIQMRYVELYAKLEPYLTRIINKKGKVLISPSLEDNFSDSAFGAAVSLLNRFDSVRSNKVQLVRNPCPNCFSGNGKQIPDGVLHEKHSCKIVNTDIASNDGGNYVLAGRVNTYRPKCELAQLQQTMRGYSNLGIPFFLWSAGLQGRQSNAAGSPQTRDYEILTTNEKAFLANFLRTK